MRHNIFHHLVFITVLLVVGASGQMTMAQQCAAKQCDPLSFDLNPQSCTGLGSRVRYQSMFWAGMDAMWLTHSGSEFRSEILDPNNNAVTVSQTLEHGFPMTPRFRLGSLLTDTIRAELSYFGTTGWESSAQIRNVAPLPDLDADVTYDAELHNFECNFFSPQTGIDSHWLFGFRYLQYQDSFSETYRLNTGFGSVIEEAANGQSENSAFGPQVGAGLDLGRGLLHFGGKVGFMNNRIRQSGPSYTNAILIDGNPETRFDNESDEFALLGDLEVTMTRYLTPNIAVRVGYQGLFLNNIAQSATQNGAQSDLGSIAFHGLMFGAEWIR